jgi:SAM-dependent methyltransferase
MLCHYTNKEVEGYSKDLAFIHDAGFITFSRRAGDATLVLLRRAGVRRGLIVDIGCGSGTWVQQLINAGYNALGLDLSPPMIEFARRRVPQADFRIASIHNFSLPRCSAVTAFGEIFNYRFDRRLSPIAIFRRIHRALESGGYFIFDLLEMIPGKQTTRVVEGNEWLVISEVRQKGRQYATRRIVSFRKVGRTYRRTNETHSLRLYSFQAIRSELSRTGFAVRSMRKFGKLQLQPGHLIFIARKK